MSRLKLLLQNCGRCAAAALAAGAPGALWAGLQSRLQPAPISPD